MACMTCGTPLALGAAFAATKGDGWHSYCERCAADTKAQIAGLIARIETLVAPLGANVPANVTDVVQYLTPQIEAILAGTGGDAVSRSSRPAASSQVDRRGQGCHAARPGSHEQLRRQVRHLRHLGAEKKGRIEKINGRWATFHLDGECVTAKVRRLRSTWSSACTCTTTAPSARCTPPATSAWPSRCWCPSPRARSTRTARRSCVARSSTSRAASASCVTLLAAGTAHVLTEAEAGAFGRQFSFCVNCGLYLDDDRSLAAGYGPTCAENNHWFYPTYDRGLRRSSAAPPGPNPAKVAVASNPRFEEQAAAEAAATPTAICKYCDETSGSGEPSICGSTTPAPRCARATTPPARTSTTSRSRADPHHGGARQQGAPIPTYQPSTERHHDDHRHARHARHHDTRRRPPPPK